VSAREVIAAALLAGGVALELVCCLGLIVMRSTLDRLHYVAPASFGVLLIAAAITVAESASLIADKALATAAILIVTGPVVVHVTARTARTREHGDWTIQPSEDVEVER
jgi:multisubunit Na+/H+ antiporter MnhG subunit